MWETDFIGFTRSKSIDEQKKNLLWYKKKKNVYIWIYNVVYFQLKCIFRMCLMLEIAEIKFWFNDLIWFSVYIQHTQKYVVENEIEEKIKYIFTWYKKKSYNPFRKIFLYQMSFYPISIFKSILCTFDVPIGFLFSSIRISKCYKFCCRRTEYYSVPFIIKLNLRLFFHFYTTLNFKNNKLSVNFEQKKELNYNKWNGNYYSNYIVRNVITA